MQLLLKVLLLPYTATVAAVRWFGNVTVAARIGWIVALFQLVVVLLAVGVVLWTGDLAVLQSWWSPGKPLALLVLLLIVPVLVHQAARLWLEHHDGRWPDIKAAWDAATAELARQQISLIETPLFLVFGSDGGELERALFAELSTALVVEQSPSGGGPLHLFASHDAIFVCLSGAGQTSVAAKALRAAVADGARIGDSPLTDPVLVGEQEASGQPFDSNGGGRQRPAPTTITPKSSKERREAVERLEYASDQLRQARVPMAAINGIVVLLPLQINHPSSAVAASLGQALGEDLATVTRVLGVRAPVTVLLGVLQDDPAIDELLGRLEPEKRSAACGNPFPPGLTPTPESLRALALNATGPLSDHLEELLLDPRRIAQQPTNRHLLSMLFRLRLHVSSQLIRVLPPAFCPDPRQSADGIVDVAPLLAGCYVASISRQPKRRAFVREVLDRVVHLQGELDWTDESLRSEAWARRTSRVLFAAAVAMVAAIGAIVWWKLSR